LTLRLGKSRLGAKLGARSEADARAVRRLITEM